MEKENDKNKDINFPWKRAEKNPSLIQKGTEIKLSPLPEKSTESYIYFLLKDYGNIINIDLKNNYAYIRFQNLSETNHILSLKKLSINNKNYYIYPSNDNIEIFIGNLDKKWNKDYLIGELSKIINFSNIRIPLDPKNDKLNRGFAFISFMNSIEARKAYDLLSKIKIINGRFLTLDWAKGLNSVNDLNLFQLHISGIKEENSTEDLYKAFSEFGDIVFLKLSRDSNTSNRKDFGFVTYSNEEDAQRALDEFNYSKYFQNEIKIQFAKKLSSIKKHRLKVESNLLIKKRKRGEK
jgi:RNA recognition motif-containing protein